MRVQILLQSLHIDNNIYRLQLKVKLKKQTILFRCVILFCFIACSKDDDAIFIRVQNNTMLNFKEVVTYNKYFDNVESPSFTGLSRWLMESTP